MVNMLFNKVLGKNEKCVLSLYRNQRNFLANPTLSSKMKQIYHFRIAQKLIVVKYGRKIHKSIREFPHTRTEWLMGRMIPGKKSILDIR